MNERIQKLAEQAHVYADGHSLLCHEGDIKKFAELIVQECADYLDAFNRENHVEEGIGGAELKEHFGVGE